MVYRLYVRGRTIFAQVDPWRSIAFFNAVAFTRDRLGDTLRTNPMCILHVNWQSVGRALRTGAWCALGVHPMSDLLRSPKRFAHWPGFSETLVIWSGTSPEAVFRHDDPDVQDIELMAEWDAETQVSQRLEHELGLQLHPKVTGPVWRERMLRASFGLTTEPPRTMKRLQPIST